MPELPEVDAIAGVIRRHSLNQIITSVHVLKQPRNNAYFGNGTPAGAQILNVRRLGKRVLFMLDQDRVIDCHNAMTGYWDYEDDPWCFDYVEADRDPEDYVRVKMTLSNGRVLQFHDARFFGKLKVIHKTQVPELAPELMVTPFGDPTRRPITIENFAKRVLSQNRAIKEALMDQDPLHGIVSGIGNIYANESCHLAGIDPHTFGKSIQPSHIPILLEALKCVVDHCIPTIKYQWRKVYRRDQCGSCGHVVKRTELAKRATFMCEKCQG